MNMDYSNDIEKVLVSQEEIQGAVKRICREMENDFKDSDKKILLMGILKGSVVFMADIMKELTLETEIDFIVASSYKGTETTGVVTIKKDVEGDVSGKNVIIVEDIVDTGTTLYKLLDYFRGRGAKTVEICSMLNKPSRRKAPVDPKYNGFVIDDLFVIGYGLDYDQRFRNLPFVGVAELR